MTNWMELVSITVMVVVLGFAVVRPRGLPEAVAAVPGALLLLAVGAIAPHTALAEARSLGPTVAFLAAILVLSELCAREGLFEAAGRLMGRGSRGEPGRLLKLVFLAAAMTTAVLSLDATVVLLTPVVFATASRVGVRPKPHVYATAHLANSASLLLPVSNLTNLLALQASGSAARHWGWRPSGRRCSGWCCWAASGCCAPATGLVNNLPAVLVMLPLVAPAGPVAVLAVLIGVNIGPNLTYVGSLATLLWRRIVADHDHDTEVAEFTKLGLKTVPASLVLCTVALWAAARVMGV